MMNSPASNSESSSFALLDRRIQRWIWTEGWPTLRDIQERTIPVLINADQDAIIAAATASGKTEAAFFPILSNLLRDEQLQGAVLYISPLKALINDQWERLQRLCDTLEIPVIPWHGDIATSRKHKFLKDPSGILLITPESIEAIFVNRGSSVPLLTATLKYIVIDELHSFIGTERGKQLQSLLHRIDRAAGRKTPRVALSATLGNMSLAAEFLRPGAGQNVVILNSSASGQELKVLVKCYQESIDGAEGSCTREISEDLYRSLKGTNNLVFPNRRSLVEQYSDLLRRRCEEDGIPNQFWAHHGNLSKELREETERALKMGSYPATAVCTSTLELGIDIGNAKSVAQIGPPPSVASLRQRLGRSGRRAGEPAILRCYCTERQLDSDSSLSDQLRESLIQTIATINLLISGWFEPPDVGGLHASTFVQQIMSVIAERGGATASSLWPTLVQDGPFAAIDTESFKVILRELGAKKLIMQDPTGLLLHGELGEKLVNHYEFYSAFISEDEYTLQHEGHTLGCLPISRPLIKDQRIIFGGRRWRVVEADAEKKVVVVVPDPGGVPPGFDSAAASVHDRVREEMKSVLRGNDRILFLNDAAHEFLTDARAAYVRAGLDHQALIESGDDSLLLTWKGDRLNDALALILSTLGYPAWNEGIAIRVRKASRDEVREGLAAVENIEDAVLSTFDLNPATLVREKWDWALPRDVLVRSYFSSRLDIRGATEFARSQSRQMK
jgi:ATP-dependent Lhr-like helicase